MRGSKGKNEQALVDAAASVISAAPPAAATAAHVTTALCILSL